MWRSIFKGRLFGHPIHPMLVHFPTALFRPDFYLMSGIFFQEPSLYLASFYVILMGLATGLLAGVFGLIDYVRLGTRPEVFQKASWHAGIQFMVLVIFGMIAGVKYQAYPNIVVPDFWQLLAMGFGVGLMIVGNYLGGELVFRYKVGVTEDKVGE